MWITTTLLNLWPVDISKGGYDGRKMACEFHGQRLLNSERKKLNLLLYSSTMQKVDYEHWAVNLDAAVFYYVSCPCFEFSCSVIHPFQWSQSFQTNIGNIFFSLVSILAEIPVLLADHNFIFPGKWVWVPSFDWKQVHDLRPKIEEQKDFSCPNYCFLF